MRRSAGGASELEGAEPLGMVRPALVIRGGPLTVLDRRISLRVVVVDQRPAHLIAGLRRYVGGEAERLPWERHLQGPAGRGVLAQQRALDGHRLPDPFSVPVPKRQSAALRVVGEEDVEERV